MSRSGNLFRFLFMKKKSHLRMLALVLGSVVALLKNPIKTTSYDSWFVLLSPTDLTTFHSEYTISHYNKAASYSTTKYERSEVQLICWFGTRKVCAVQIDYSASYPVSDLNDADFSSSYGTDILGYEFMN